MILIQIWAKLQHVTIESVTVKLRQLTYFSFL